MPVVAVVAAVAVDAGAAAAFAGGLALTSTLGVLTAVTAIGATTSAIGAVTGNKTLEIAGGALGIVGGIGTLATSAGLFGDAAASGSDSIFGASTAGASGAGDAGAASAAASATDPGDAIAQGAANPATSTITTSDNPVGAINATSTPTAGGAVADAGGQAGVVPAGSLSPDQINALSMDTQAPVTTAAATSGGSAATGAGAVDPNAAASMNADVNAAAPPGTSAYNDAILSNGLSGMSGGTPTTGGLAAWAKNNQLLSYGILQAGGSLISGLTNPMTPAQIDALNAQANANNAAAALAEKQAANVGQPLPSATISQPVAGSAAPASGLINNKPVASPLITGTPSTTPIIANTQVTGVPA